MKLYFSFILLIIIGCKSQNYQIEKASKIDLKEGFFQIVPAAIKEGRSSTRIFIELNIKDLKGFILNGVYFRGNYLKKKDNNYPNKINSYFKNRDSKTDINKNSPFKLHPNEVVVDYFIGNKRKYSKFEITRNDSIEEIPR